MKILLVEDDDLIAKTIENVLIKQHYIVDIAKDGQSGWELIKVFTYDLILLDVVLPKLNGIDFCRRLRNDGNLTPVLLLTAQSSSREKVIGLDAGADDYVVKPFEISELLARIRVLLRRRNSLEPSVWQWGNLRLDPSTCEVVYNGKSLHLTPKEYRLLELFLRNRDRVFSRNAILEHLWSVEEAPSEDTVTAHIKGLRQKLKQAGAPSDLIKTVYGLGYRLKLHVSEGLESSASDSQTAESLRREQTSAAIAEVWEKFKGKSSDRLEVLEQAILALLENSLDDELLQQAQQAAHKLAGALGVFGFKEGSRLAQEIEQVLITETSLTKSIAPHLSELAVSLRLSLGKDSFSQPPQFLVGHKYPLIIAVDDTLLAKRIVKEATRSDLHLELASNLSAAKAILTRYEPDEAQSKLDGIVLNFSFTDSTEDNLSFLAELTKQTPPAPVILLTTNDRLSDRLQAARLGTHVFFSKSQFPNRLLKLMIKLLKQVKTKVAKVMVVDDDPKVLSVLRTLLEPWGLKLATLNDPRQFWNVLSEFSPDFLVLDVEMPHVSGIEICQVVRNDPYWYSLPILFFTIHNDVNTMHRVLNSGADEYLSKSVDEPEIVNRIFNSLERARLRQNFSNLAKKQEINQFS